MSPYFSVVIPFFNRQKLLLEAIDSVLRQSLDDFEIIVIDDGSTEVSVDLVESFQDSRIHYKRQANLGGATARNTGIDLANGKFIAFLDSDDKFLPNKLERIKSESAINKADVYFSYTIVDRGAGTKGRKPSRALMPGEPIDEFLFSARQPIQTSTLVVRSTLAKSIRFEDGLKKGQDLDFVLRLYRAGAKFHFIDEALSIWTDNSHDERVSHRRYAKELEDWLTENRTLMSPRAYYGFRANVLSFEIAKSHPFTAIWDIMIGVVRGGVSIKRAFHSAARAFVHRDLYRNSVNRFLKLTGKEK